MQFPEIPRVTYTNIGVDFSGLHAMLDREIPAARKRLGADLPHIIGGKEDRAGRRYDIFSPIDRSLKLATCHIADDATVARAVEAARAAAPGWAATDWKERVEIIEAAAKRFGDRRFDLGIACLLEVGKSRFEAIGEAEEALDIIPFYAEEMRRNDGYLRALAAVVPGEDCSTRMRPYGVFGIVTPYNFPIATPLNLSVSALMTGNTVVLKPSEGSGLTASIIADCLIGAGLPPGVFNVVMGNDDTGKALIGGQIDGAAFTGSSQVGHSIHSTLAGKLGVRPVIAEMGGKNPTIVTRSADIDTAAEGLVRSAFGLQGEKCSACEVAYVEASIYDALADALVEKASNLKIGTPERADVFVGPLIDAAAGEKYLAVANEARKAGRILHGGNRLSGGEYDGGVYVEPLIVGDLPPDHTQIRQELFLPYLALQKFTSLPDALSRANAIAYGLSAGFYGKDPAELRYFLDHAQAGTLYANRRTGATTGAWPGVQSFGGWKASSLTGKNAFGPHYLPLFMREQNQTVIRP